MYDNFSLSVENIQMLVALANENWRDELTKSASPMFILSPSMIQVNLGVCKWKKDPGFPLCKIKSASTSLVRELKVLSRKVTKSAF